MKKRGRGSFQFLPALFRGKEVKNFMGLNSSRRIQAENDGTDLEKIPDPFTALREAMQVEPGGDLAARIRTRVATAPRPSPSLIPRFAIAAMTGAVLAVVAAGVWREADPFVAESVLPHRDLIVLAQAPRVGSSPPSQLPLQRSRGPSGRTDVVVSRSEMLALQRLFSGITVAPAPNPIAVELLIPELTIEPIAPFPAGPEGERQ